MLVDVGVTPFTAKHFRIRIRALNGRFHWTQPESRFGFGKSNTHILITELKSYLLFESQLTN